MKRSLTLAAAVVAAFVMPLTLHAHRQWLFPSATVLSGNDPWVTIDAAISNDLFYFEHFPLRLDNLVVLAPDGAAVQAENAATGRYRSTFDVHLTQKGTYRIAVVGDSVAATYTDNGQTKTWRGTSDAFAREVPANAPDLKVSRTNSRVEVFVTSGSPTDKVLAPTGKGLELVPVTHPNDLVAGEKATFAFVLEGKPAANLPVTLIPGGIRYRDALGEIKATTDAQGRFTVTMPEPGMYWLNASVSEGGPSRQGPPPSASDAPQSEGRGGPLLSDQPQAGGPRAQAGPGGPGRPGGPGGPGAGRPIVPGRRANYVATLEVLPQ